MSVGQVGREPEEYKFLNTNDRLVRTSLTIRSSSGKPPATLLIKHMKITMKHFQLSLFFSGARMVDHYHGLSLKVHEM